VSTFAITFTNFGPYHLARLRALAIRLRHRGDRLIAYEVAGRERRYPWLACKGAEPFEWNTIFPGRDLESLSRLACYRAQLAALARDRPDAVALVGYARPESMASLAWARREGRPAVLMSETQAIDHSRAWWKEAIKRRRVRRCDAALVGGPRHAAYLAELGMSTDRIVLGYNAIDNDYYTERAAAARSSADGRRGLPDRPYFLAASRFVAEKNLPRLVRAFATYRTRSDERSAWDLVLVGDGPGAAAVEEAVEASGVAGAIHRPGFLQIEELTRWYAFAGAFVHPSLMEPWGLVVNEAAACGLPLLVSERAGCVETLVPDPTGTTGGRFDPRDERELSDALWAMANLPETDRIAMGRRAAEVVADWGPDRFARGALDAFDIAAESSKRRRVPVAEVVR
jgi:glycosyltransferase involved in cell wall biosynthesis